MPLSVHSSAQTDDPWACPFLSVTAQPIALRRVFPARSFPRGQLFPLKRQAACGADAGIFNEAPSSLLCLEPAKVAFLSKSMNTETKQALTGLMCSDSSRASAAGVTGTLAVLPSWDRTGVASPTCRVGES